jgi:DNA-binding response OmpR family regulator
MNILIAEDDAVTRMLLESTLKRRGYDVTAVADGADAWAALQRMHFPVLISDYLMPGLDGFELVRRVRASRPDSYTYVILLTVMGGKLNHLEAIDAGADDFVVKPFDPDLLYARLHVAERILGLQRHVMRLEGLLCICADCKKIRDRDGEWSQLEGYITDHAGVLFSHSFCPQCAEKWMDKV